MVKHYNKRYKSDGFYWGIQPNDIVKDALSFVSKKGNALDLGGGEGRDAMFLASNGFKVLVVDKAKEGLKKARSLADKNSLHIKTKNMNISDFPFSGEYELISCCNVLQFLEQEEVFSIIKKIQLHTSIGGLNIIRAFSEKNPEKHFPFLFKSRQLEELYLIDSWKILKYEEFVTPYEVHPGFPMHQHGIAQIIARKKG